VSPPKATSGSTPGSTPTAPAPTCPPGTEVGNLPSGQTLTWTPIVEPDPRGQTGTSGAYVQVWNNNISGYTWSVSASDGATSGPCNGTPTNGGACLAYPAPLTATWYRWDDGTHQWVVSGDAGVSDGCSGGTSGGNS
jgi:hypothetical protein